MAERRMFAKTIIDSDAFLDMPLSTQALYFHLSMRADDEGFINNPRKIQRMIGASEDDYKVLVAKNFIIPFESGVVVIKHWKIHNYIRGDRIHDTKYTEEKSLLSVKDNGSYTLNAVSCPSSGCQLSDKMDTEVRLGKDSIGKYTNGDFSNAPSENDTPNDDEIFEQLWKLYPRKEGKSNVSNSQKKKIAKIGLEKMTRCVERFNKSMQGREKQYIMQGGRFFNKCYVDYLDENYEAENSTNKAVEDWLNEEE